MKCNFCFINGEATKVNGLKLYERQTGQVHFEKISFQHLVLCLWNSFFGHAVLASSVNVFKGRFDMGPPIMEVRKNRPFEPPPYA